MKTENASKVHPPIPDFEDVLEKMFPMTPKEKKAAIERQRIIRTRKEVEEAWYNGIVPQEKGSFKLAS